MTQQTEKICFRYDGSEEAKKCIEWINKRFNVNHNGYYHVYYHNDTSNTMGFVITQHPTHRLVTPAEFLRLVKGEPEWKVGDECMIDEQHNLKTYKIEHITSDNVCMLNCLTIDKGYTIRHLSTLRPIRKSVREELTAMLWGGYDAGAKADEILSKFNVTPKH